MKILASSLLCAVCAFGLELNAEMKAYIDELKKEAKEQNPSFVDFSAKNGEILFKTENIGKENKKLSCVSCHGSDLSQKAQNIFTGKDIDPLAPSVNKARLSDAKEVKTMANCSACHKKLIMVCLAKKRLKHLLMVLGETSEVF